MDPAYLHVNSLANELLTNNEQRPEPWLAMASHAELKGNKERALMFVDKVRRDQYGRSFMETCA